MVHGRFLVLVVAAIFSAGCTRPSKEPEAKPASKEVAATEPKVTEAAPVKKALLDVLVELGKSQGDLCDGLKGELGPVTTKEEAIALCGLLKFLPREKPSETIDSELRSVLKLAQKCDRKGSSGGDVSSDLARIDSYL